MDKIRICYLAVFFIFLPKFCLGDVIKLKNGAEVEGTITQRTDKYIKIEIAGAEVLYLNSEIASFSLSDQAESGTDSQSVYKAYESFFNPVKIQGRPDFSQLEKKEETKDSKKTSRYGSGGKSPQLEAMSEYQELVKKNIDNLKVQPEKTGQADKTKIIDLGPLPKTEPEGQAETDSDPVAFPISHPSKTPSQY